MTLIYDFLETSLFLELINQAILIIQLQRSTFCSLCIPPADTTTVDKVWDSTDKVFILSESGLDAVKEVVGASTEAVDSLYGDIKDYLYFFNDMFNEVLECPGIKKAVDDALKIKPCTGTDC